MLLDPADPSRVLARTSEPILAPETEEERDGTVPNVVFPTAIEEVEGVRYVFYGMADSKIGVARLEHA
jgi:beta-1,2-mannobiose phosphorylase / 1,2-beta-oligomannan phosphorylase